MVFISYRTDITGFFFEGLADIFSKIGIVV
jgi:hypothetical protein